MTHTDSTLVRVPVAVGRDGRKVSSRHVIELHSILIGLAISDPWTPITSCIRDVIAGIALRQRCVGVQLCGQCVYQHNSYCRLQNVTCDLVRKGSGGERGY